MKIEQIYTGCLAQASYYIECNGEAAVIDPLRDIDVYINKAKDSNATIKYIFETHLPFGLFQHRVLLQNQN